MHRRRLKSTESSRSKQSSPFWERTFEGLPSETHVFQGRFGSVAGRSTMMASISCMNSKLNLQYVIFLAATAALGGLLFGFDVAIITGAGPFLTELSNSTT